MCLFRLVSHEHVSDLGKGLGEDRVPSPLCLVRGAVRLGVPGHPHCCQTPPRLAQVSGGGQRLPAPGGGPAHRWLWRGGGGARLGGRRVVALLSQSWAEPGFRSEQTERPGHLSRPVTQPSTASIPVTRRLAGPVLVP